MACAFAQIYFHKKKKIIRAMPQTHGVSPHSQAGFGILTASQLCIAHKSIEAYPLEASLDYAGRDQPA